MPTPPPPPGVVREISCIFCQFTAPRPLFGHYRSILVDSAPQGTQSLPVSSPPFCEHVHCCCRTSLYGIIIPHPHHNMEHLPCPWMGPDGQLNMVARDQPPPPPGNRLGRVTGKPEAYTESLPNWGSKDCCAHRGLPRSIAPTGHERWRLGLVLRDCSRRCKKNLNKGAQIFKITAPKVSDNPICRAAGFQGVRETGLRAPQSHKGERSAWITSTAKGMFGFDCVADGESSTRYLRWGYAKSPHPQVSRDSHSALQRPPLGPVSVQRAAGVNRTGGNQSIIRTDDGARPLCAPRDGVVQLCAVHHLRPGHPMHHCLRL